VAHVLRLVPAENCAWRIVAGDTLASAMLPRLAEAMQLQTDLSHTDRVMVLVCDGRGPPFSWPADARPYSAEHGGEVCVVNPGVGRNSLTSTVRQIAAVVGWDVQRSGGALLHSALAVWHGRGVILAGSGGAGKTTASRRLPPPWRSLCDDLTLVVRDRQAAYWAHPWPTPSSFMYERPGTTCDVQHGVPLAGIFFLERALADRVEPVAGGRAAGLLLRAAEEVLMTVEQRTGPIVRGSVVEDVRALRLERFDNLCTLVRTVPVYSLHLGLTGPFWQDMEHALARSTEDGGPTKPQVSTSAVLGTIV
jgi:hypothetical protein